MADESKGINDTRRRNLREQSSKAGGPARLAELLGKSESEISQMIGQNPIRNIGHKRARDIEHKLGLAPYALDEPPPEFPVLVHEAATELAKRDESTQRYILGLIRRLPERDAERPPPPDDPSDSKVVRFHGPDRSAG